LSAYAKPAIRSALFGLGEAPPEIAAPFLAEIDRVLDAPGD
jgi:hypothetical protein